MGTNHWHPSWWNETHASAWERAKEALRRDFDQTKHDLHLGGHEYNQGIKDTVAQAAGKEAIPAGDKPNPGKVIGDIREWSDVEGPMKFGHAARERYGSEHASWSEALEAKLQGEWGGAIHNTKAEWGDVKRWVRQGYEHKTDKS